MRATLLHAGTNACCNADTPRQSDWLSSDDIEVRKPTRIYYRQTRAVSPINGRGAAYVRRSERTASATSSRGALTAVKCELAALKPTKTALRA